MPSIRSIFVFAATALTAFVAASPTASFTNVQAVPDALTAAKSQLLALQADVEKAINAGSVTDAEAANAYIDKMASIVSGAKASYKASNVQASNTALSASSNADLISSLEDLLTEVVQAVGQLLSSLLGSVSISAREAVVAKASATLDDPLSSLLSQVGSLLSGLLSAVGQALSGLLGSLTSSGLKATSKLLAQ